MHADDARLDSFIRLLGRTCYTGSVFAPDHVIMAAFRYWCILALAFLGCTDPTDSDVVSSEDLVGTFYLDSLNGQSLPYTTGNTAVYKVLLRLDHNEGLSWTIDSGFCSPVAQWCDELEGAGTGSWLLLSSGDIDVTGAGVHTAGASRAPADPNRLVFGGTAIYKRVDPAAVVRAIDIRPDSFELSIGQARNVFTTTIPYVPNVSVIVRDTSVAAFGAGIAVIGRGIGTTYVIASADGLRDSARVTVR
jgi:hypothetical protein